jgi:multidrug efflux pump subunit AcrA (membrane-fusion protein)
MDPDRLFTRLAPKLWFLWTRTFLIVSAVSILVAALTLWANRQELPGSVTHALRWETLVRAWLVLLVITALHESAHGLTCKRYGGEVHEIGFLMLYFLPCFYGNVSDAWLFRERSKRLWVTFAGGYFELFVWSLAVFAWRLTQADSLVHELSFVVLSVSGVQTLFNFNPLLKLDGYYLLSDWLAIPNLHQRGLNRFQGVVRRLLWGAPRPRPEQMGRLVAAFGLATWAYSTVILWLMLWALGWFLWAHWGWPAAIAVAALGLVSGRSLFHGIFAGEVTTMITTRRLRTICWLLGLAGLTMGLFLVEIDDRASGPFRLRPANRTELRAPVAGFLRAVYCDEGDWVSAGNVVARLEVADLESRLSQKQAELRESQARLRLLEAGPRSEEVAEQRQRVTRAEAWRDLAREDLAHFRQACADDLDRLQKQTVARRAELEAAEESYRRAKTLVGQGVLASEQHAETLSRYRVCQARLAEAEATERASRARGTLEPEAEIARRERELADARATLRLLEAGARPDEVEAGKAGLARLEEEIRHLEETRQKQSIVCPLAGVVTTARLREKAGQYLREGELICLVEEAAVFDAEIILAEQDVARVRPGQDVRLKVRALPHETLTSRVEWVSPTAGKGDAQSSVTVYCRLDRAPGDLRPEMTGYASGRSAKSSWTAPCASCARNSGGDASALSRQQSAEAERAAAGGRADRARSDQPTRRDPQTAARRSPGSGRPHCELRTGGADAAGDGSRAGRVVVDAAGRVYRNIRSGVGATRGRR